MMIKKLHRINLDRLEKAVKYLYKVNSIPIDEIVWMRNGTMFTQSPKKLEDWKFVGLSNVWYCKVNNLIDSD